MSPSTLCLCRHGGRPLLGLTRGPREQEVILTVQGDGVLGYDADAQVRIAARLPARTRQACALAAWLQALSRGAGCSAAEPGQAYKPWFQKSLACACASREEGP